MFDIDDEIESFASSPEEADRESARRQLIRMFPNLDEEELIELEESNLMRLTLNRVIHTMTHLKSDGFSLDKKFNNDLFYQAKEEAFDLLLWAESPDDTPMPESLKYKAPEDDVVESGEEVTVETDIPKKTRKPRGTSPNSKYQKCLNIIRDDLLNNIGRTESISKIIQEFGMNKATAESYYSKAKTFIETGH